MRYTREAEIGSGTSGTVYRALDHGTGDVVALKVLKAAAGIPKSEVAIARKVTHPNVCRVFDYFEDHEGLACIAMEFVDGRNLRLLMDECGAMPLERCLPIALQILDGMEAAHLKNVVHRDLKPENILLTSDGTVKISDFSHARPIDDPQASPPPGAGTPAYMPPEQAMGRHADARADIFAFGIILFEMLSGQRPESPVSFPAGVPVYIETAVRRCMCLEPNDRFSSVAELRDALTRRHAVRPARAFTGLLAACLVITILFAVFLWRGRQQMALRAPAQAPVAEKPQDEKAEVESPLADGLYFLHNNMLPDALDQFDRLLQADAKSIDAHFYRGVTLAKLKRWDDALVSFKRALPRAKADRRVTWSWDAPFASNSTTSLIVAVDLSQGLVPFEQRRIVFAERSANATVLYFPDLRKHIVRRLELPDRTISLNAVAYATDLNTILMAADFTTGSVPEKVGFYAVTAADGSVAWHTEFRKNEDYSLQPPMAGSIPFGFYVYLSERERFTFINDRTGKPRWTLDNFQLDRRVPPILQGETLLLKTGTTYKAVRVADGTEAWSLAVPDFAPGVTPVLDGTNVYFVSDASDLYSIDTAALAGTPTPSPAIRWKVPLGKPVHALRSHDGRLYLLADQGELLVLDAKTGAATFSMKLTGTGLRFEYAGSDVVVVSSDKTIYGLDPSGEKRWEYPFNFIRTVAEVFKGVVTFRPSLTERVGLDSVTGKVVWRTSAQSSPGVITTDEQMFLVDANRIREYTAGKTPEGVGQKDVLTEVASILITKGELEEAGVLVDKVAREMDADYAPLRVVKARLLLAKEKAAGRQPPAQAGMELATYADIAGHDSADGQRAIAELKQDYGLLWSTTLESAVGSRPALMGDRIVSVGRSSAGAQVIALNRDNGRTAWRHPAERIMDSVAIVAGGRRFVFYLTGEASDSKTVILYRVSVESGERQELGRWSRRFPAVQTMIAQAAGRLFVATASLPSTADRIETEIACFDAASGQRLWQKSHDEALGSLQAQVALGLFVAQGDFLVYSIGHEIRAVRAADGNAVDQQHEDGLIRPSTRTAVPGAGPVYFISNLKEISEYDVARKQITKRPRPDIDTPLLIRNGSLFGMEAGGLFGFGLRSGLKWRIPATTDLKYQNVIDGDEHLWALRDDNVLAGIDRATGKVVSEHAILWRPTGFTVAGNRFYAFTSHGLAYAIELQGK